MMIALEMGQSISYGNGMMLLGARCSHLKKGKTKAEVQDQERQEHRALC